jgi:branched-chain amino acid transport system substrate-binding protein
VDKLISTLKGFKVNSAKGTEEIRACDQVRLSSWIIVRGLGAKAKDWNFGEVVAEIPWQETMETCENNINDVPFGQVKLPGK